MIDNIDHYALVIGIDKYPQLSNVSAAVSNASSFMEWLRSPDGGGLPARSIYSLFSPPELPASPLDARPIRSEVDEALVKLGADKQEQIGKRLYFYFAGQACGTSLDDVSMLMADASLTRLGSNISLSRYRQFLCQSTLFEEVVYILDCAFLEPQFSPEPAGPALALSPIPRRTSVKEFILMSSPKVGKGGQPDDVGGKANPGILTKAVLEGLTGAAASSEGDTTSAENLQGRVTAVSLGDYVRARVRDLATGPKLLQLPEMLLPCEEIIFAKVAISLLSGTLIIQVPHWSAEIDIFNSLLQLVAGPVKIIALPDASDIYQAETKLPAGISKVDVTLEGQVESQYAAIQFNKTSTIKKDSWKNLKFSSAAPLTGTATTHEWHMGPAVEWSKKITWKDSPGGPKRTSRLFLFVRTTEPDRYKMYSKGLRLLDAIGNLITDFSHGVEKDVQYGWMAFCADLEPGCYILRRGRVGIRLRQQPIYLCEGWETQVFLQAEARPSLRTQTLNMALKGTGFQPNDETAIAAEAVLDSIRYGGSFKQLVTKEKLSLLLHGKFENPWLGVLAAYVLRSQLDEQTGDPDQESHNLLAHVMSFLDQISDHPDVRALKLQIGEPAPKPFTHPPLLIKGLKLVQHHARKFAGTIPRYSLTDLVLDNLVLDSPWTAWRHLKTHSSILEKVDPAIVESGKQLARILTGKALTHAASVLQSNSPKAPVLRLADIMKDTGKRIASSRASVHDIASFAVNALRDAPLLDIIQALMQQDDLDALPETVTLNHEKGISDLLGGVKAEEISQASGLSLAHTESSLQRLRESSSAQVATAETSSQEPELSSTDKVVLEYALAESARQSGSSVPGQRKPQDEAEKGDAPSDASSDVPPTDDAGAQLTDLQLGQNSSITIEDCVAAIRGEAARLLPRPEDPVNNSDSETAVQAQVLIDRLRKVATNLFDRAAFTVTTEGRGHILYANRAFISLITPADDFLKQDERERQLKSNHRAWEKVLAKPTIGQSMISNPVAGVSPIEFRLWRTAINDGESKKAKAYLNTMRGKDAAAVTQSTLQQINELLPDLARYASFFSYDSSEGRKEHALKLEKITLTLEGIINDSVNTPTPINNSGNLAN